MRTGGSHLTRVSRNLRTSSPPPLGRRIILSSAARTLPRSRPCPSRRANASPCLAVVRKQKKYLKVLAREYKDAKKDLKEIQDRKKQFEKGAAIAFHRFKNAGEAIVAVDEAIQVIQDVHESQLRLKEELKACKLKLKQKANVWMGEASVDLSEAVGQKLTMKVICIRFNGFATSIMYCGLYLFPSRSLSKIGKLRGKRVSADPGMVSLALITSSG